MRQMPIYVEWGDDRQTFAVTRYVGDWTWEEFDNAYQESLQMANTTTSDTIDFVNDFSASGKLPPNALLHFVRSVRLFHPKTRFIVSVAITPALKRIMFVMKTILPDVEKNTYVFETMQEAKEFFAEHSQTRK